MSQTVSVKSVALVVLPLWIFWIYQLLLILLTMKIPLNSRKTASILLNLLLPASAPTYLNANRLSKPFFATTSLSDGVLQRFVLGPLPFSFYTASINEIILQHDMFFNQFADNISLFIEVLYDNSNTSLDFSYNDLNILNRAPCFLKPLRSLLIFP